MNSENYRIFVAGQDTMFLEDVKDELTKLMHGDEIQFSPVPENIEDVEHGDAIVLCSENGFAGLLKTKAMKAGIPLVLIDSRDDRALNFSVEEPVFFAAADSDATSVAEFLSLIVLFNRKFKMAGSYDNLEERIELIDEVVADFGNSLNSKLCTIIGYADFALSESSLEEMQKALQISLEAGLDTAQLLQNMLLSVKAIVRKKKKKWAA